MPIVVCPYCTNGEPFCAPSEQLLERHIRCAHSQDPGFRIECKNTSCSRVFTNYRTYKNHLLTHKDENDLEPMGSNSRGPEDSGEPMDNTLLNNYEDEMEPPLVFDDYCAKWILKTSETRQLTRTATVGIVGDVSELLLEVVAQIKTQVGTCLRENGLEPNTIAGLDNIFSSHNHTVTPFNNLSTFHHQLSYYKRQFHFIVSYCLTTL